MFFHSLHECPLQPTWNLYVSWPSSMIYLNIIRELIQLLSDKIFFDNYDINTNSEHWSLNSDQWTVNRDQWTVNSDQWTVNSERWTANSEQRSVNSGQWPVDSEQWTGNSGQWTLFTYHCPLFTVHWSLFTVRCPLFTDHCSLFTVHWSLFAVHWSLFIALQAFSCLQAVSPFLTPALMSLDSKFNILTVLSYCIFANWGPGHFIGYVFKYHMVCKTNIFTNRVKIV